MVVLVGEDRPERPVDGVPGGEPLRKGRHGAVAALRQQVLPLPAWDDGQLRGTMPPQQVQEIVLYHDTGATAVHRAWRALVYLHRAANPTQRDPGAQAADRATGHNHPQRQTALAHATP